MFFLNSGDGILQAPEECDLGVKLNGAPGSSCTKDCKKCPVCGDGNVDAGEGLYFPSRSLLAS